MYSAAATACKEILSQDEGEGKPGEEVLNVIQTQRGGEKQMWTAIATIAVVIAVVCVAVNQIITNFTVTELQSQQRQLQQQLEQLRTQQSE